MRCHTLNHTYTTLTRLPTHPLLMMPLPTFIFENTQVHLTLPNIGTHIDVTSYHIITSYLNYLYELKFNLLQSFIDHFLP